MKPLVRPTVRCLATAMAGLFAVSAAASPQAPPFRNPDLPADERITNLLSLMTPDEKLQALGGFGSGVPRLGVPGFGASEGIHGLVLFIHQDAHGGQVIGVGHDMAREAVEPLLEERSRLRVFLLGIQLADPATELRVAFFGRLGRLGAVRRTLKSCACGVEGSLRFRG